MKIDRTSLLVDVEGATTLGALEDALSAAQLTLGVSQMDREATVAAWLAAGAPGARDPWSDPADHLVAGLEATLHDGRPLSIRAAPRRAVGPDLVALIVGMNERYAGVDRAVLRVHPAEGPMARVHPLHADRNPPLESGEIAMLDAISACLRRPPTS